MRTSHRHHAFTLVEMLLVLVILAVLAAIVIPKMSGRSQQSKLAAAGTQIGGFELALNMFEADTGAYPKSLDGIVDEPNGAKDWKGPYMKNIPVDPWGNPYLYAYPGKKNARGLDLSSAGPDGQMGTDDDINNWDAKK